MTLRTRQILQGLLITLVTASLALLVFSTFRRVLEPPDPERVAARTAELSATTTTAAEVAVPTTNGPRSPEQPGGTATTAAPTEPGPGRSQRDCQEQAPANAQGTVVALYFTCGTGAIPNISGNAYRTVPVTEAELTATLTELVQGPDGEESDLGFTSVFSEATSGVFGGVGIDGGTAFVDFVDLAQIQGLDQPTVANAMLASLNATVFQFETVDAVEYRLGGSCQSFWTTLGGECAAITRQQWNRQLAAMESDG